jgi:hypothetical protein
MYFTKVSAYGHLSNISKGIPPSLYALSRGGTESSATIADVFDIGGFALLAAFKAAWRVLRMPLRRLGYQRFKLQLAVPSLL